MKGSIFDMAGVLMFVFISAIVLFLMAFLLDAFHTQALATPMIAGNVEAMAVIGQGETTLQGMDGLLAFAVFMVCLVTVISAFLVPSHPVMFILFFFIVLILVPVSAMLSNMFEEMYTVGPLAGIEVDYPVTLLVFEWLPRITVGISALIAIAMWAAGGSMKGGMGGGGVY